MGNLRRSISIQIRSISQHASKQSDIDSLGTMEDRRNFLLHLGNVLTLIKSSNRQISKLIDLIVCDENQIVGRQRALICARTIRSLDFETCRSHHLLCQPLGGLRQIRTLRRNGISNQRHNTFGALA